MDRRSSDEPRPLRVGLVDPDPRRAARLGRLLAHDPGAALVGIAGDGAEALALARRGRPEVMLLAPTLPRLDGLTALRLLQESAPVATATLAREDDVECVLDALALGAMGTVNVDDPALAEPGGLVRHLHALLDGDRVRLSEIGGTGTARILRVEVPTGAAGEVGEVLRAEHDAAALHVVLDDPVWLVEPLARRLHHSTPWRVLPGAPGDVLATGHALVTASSERHTLERDARGRLRVRKARPSGTSATTAPASP